MRKGIAVFVSVFAAGMIQAQMIVLEGVNDPAVTTGDLLDGVRNLGITTNVQEIGGLIITARSGAANQQINALAESLGIDTDGSADDSSHFESGEKLILSFSKDIQINQFDFNHFDPGETFVVSIDGMPVISIAYSDLANKSTDVINTNLLVAATTAMEFYSTGGSVIGLDGIDVTVLETSAGLTLSLSTSNGMAAVSARFGGTGSQSFVLQHKAGLAESNDWQTISAPFSTNTAWQMEMTDSTGFYRAIAR